MAKDTAVVPPPDRQEYFYECVWQVDVGYMNYCNRREFIVPGRRPPDQLYMMRFKPGGRGGYPSILYTKKPIARHFTDPVERHRNRVDLRTGEKKDHVTKGHVKFRLMDPSQVSESIRLRAVELELRPFDYADGEVVDA